MMKFRKPLLLLSACASMLLMVYCGDTVVEAIGPGTPSAVPPDTIRITDPKDPIATTAMLNVVVRDNSTGKPLDSATVTLLSIAGAAIKSEKSSIKGAVTFDNVYVGTQNVLVEKKGYAGVVATTTIRRDGYYDAGQDIYIANDNTVEVPIYPKTSGLDGTLYYLKDNKSELASGATVRVTLGDEIVTRIIEVKTNASGFFKFDTLPAVESNYKLTALDHTVVGTSDTTVYLSITGPNPALQPGATAHVTSVTAPFQYVQTTTPFTYRGESPIQVNRTDSVVLKFSDKINVGKITVNPVSVSPDQPIAVRYSGDSLIVTPQTGWAGGTEITISDDLKSQRGAQLQNAPIKIRIISSTDDLSTTPVTGLVIDTVPLKTHGQLGVSAIPHFYAALTNVKWKKLTTLDVDDYEVFYQKQGDKYYQRAEIYWSDYDQDDSVAYATVYINGMQPINDRTNTLVVQAKNDLSRSALSGASTLSVYANPTLTTTKGSYNAVSKIPQDSVIHWNGNAGSQLLFEQWLYGAYSGSTAQSRTFVVTFTEPMDFSNLATSGAWVNNANQTTSKITITATPGDEVNNDQEVKMTVRVAVNADAEATPDLNAVWRYTGLKSKTGKPFFIEYTEVNAYDASQGVTKIVKNTLDFRIKATQP